MKVLTKKVLVEDEEFVLIESEDEAYQNRAENNHRFYGTINYKELDENGLVRRALNGFDMAISDTISGAIQRRQNIIKMDKVHKLGLPFEEEAKLMWDIIK